MYRKLATSLGCALAGDPPRPLQRTLAQSMLCCRSNGTVGQRLDMGTAGPYPNSKQKAAGQQFFWRITLRGAYKHWSSSAAFKESMDPSRTYYTGNTKDRCNKECRATTKYALLQRIAQPGTTIIMFSIGVHLQAQRPYRILPDNHGAALMNAG